MKYKIFSDFDKDNINQLDFIPTLVLGFYVTEYEDLFFKQYEYMKKCYPKLDVLGVSSNLNIFHTLPHIDEKNNNCIFVLLDIDKNAYFVSEENLELGSMCNTFVSSNIMFFSTTYYDVERKIRNIEKQLAASCNVYGMIAGTNNKKYMSSVFYNGKFIKKGDIVCCIDASKYCLRGISIHDFEPIGLRLEITKYEGSTIFELENKPALEVLEEIMGKVEQKDIDSYTHPFFLLKKGEVVDNNSLLSSLLSVDRNIGSLTLYREITSKYRSVKLSIPIGTEDKNIKFNILTDSSLDRGILFLFACVGVRAFCGQHEHMKIMALSKSFKNKLIGCHGNGEIGPSLGKTFSQLQNQTLTMVSLYEKENDDFA